MLLEHLCHKHRVFGVVRISGLRFLGVCACSRLIPHLSQLLVSRVPLIQRAPKIGMRDGWQSLAQGGRTDHLIVGYSDSDQVVGGTKVQRNRSQSQIIAILVHGHRVQTLRQFEHSVLEFRKRTKSLLFAARKRHAVDQRGVTPWIDVIPHTLVQRVHEHSL